MSDDRNELDPTGLPSTEAVPGPADGRESIGCPFRLFHPACSGPIGKPVLREVGLG